MTQLVPPEELNFVGTGDFENIGNEFLNHFRKIGQLKPTENVLDVGCGIGRMAIPLTEYLNEDGSYEGIDIVPMGIDWCQQNITPRFPNFRFQLADVFNGAYNPSGKYNASSYRFPYDDQTFDFAFLTSVFTHLKQNDMENYLAEVARVLKVGGRAFMTFYLMNDEAKSLSKSGKARVTFEHQIGKFYCSNTRVVEGAIAYPENDILQLCDRYGYAAPDAHYGNWSGRDEFLSHQDILVAIKERHVDHQPAGQWRSNLRLMDPRYLWRRVLRRDNKAAIAPRAKKIFLQSAAKR